MQIQHISSETRKLIAELNPVYTSFSEMSTSEQEFLTDIVRLYKPKKLLELGVASGSSSVLLLNTIKDIPDSHLTSIDYSTSYYRDKTKNSGFIVNEYPDLKQKWTLYTGGMASEFMEKIGKDIDFCFIDTMHSLPGEVLDFLLVLPYLKPNAIIVFHDTNLHTWGNWPQCTSNNMLVSAISGEKIIPETFENIFFHNTLKTDFQMYFPNVTGIILDGTQKEKVWDIFNLLTQKWKYSLKSEDVISIKSILKKYYSNFYVQMFDDILNYQMNASKSEQTLLDIIGENKEIIDKRLQEETQKLQTLSEEKSSLIIKNIESVSQQEKISLDSILHNISETVASKNDLTVSVTEVSQKIKQDLKEQKDSYLNKWQRLEDLYKQFFVLQQDKFHHFDLDIKKLGKCFECLHQELSKDIEFSHKSIDGLSKAVNELKMHINLANIKKKYWYYKFMRWHPMQTKRKKYKQKYKDIKQLYKKIRETKYDF